MGFLHTIIGDAAWIQFGGFNVVRKMTEKLDGLGFDARDAAVFNECQVDIGMADLASKGFRCSWSNKGVVARITLARNPEV